jgi:predicted adenine nucleotide alpha hydrolase (AANH) superfamily ATPase
MANSLKDEVVAYFYNPNIHPRAEYLARLKAIQKIVEENKIKLVVPDWSPREYFEKIKDKNNRCDNPPGPVSCYYWFVRVWQVNTCL